MEVYRIMDAIECDCENTCGIEWGQNNTDKYPMFPYKVNGSVITYKCGACGKEIECPVENLKCEKSQFGFHFYSNGEIAWKCGMHGVTESIIAEEPDELSEKLTKVVKQNYNFPCCIKLGRGKKLSYETLRKIRYGGNINDQREKKWLRKASKKEIVEYLTFIIAEDAKEGKEYHGTLLANEINKNPAFFEKDVLELAFANGFYDFSYHIESLSDSKMVEYCIKMNSVDGLEFFESRKYFDKASKITTGLKKAEKYGSEECKNWLLNKLDTLE